MSAKLLAVLSCAAFFSALCAAQPEIPTAHFTPGFLIAGKGAAELRVWRDDFNQRCILLWNGQPRPTRADGGGGLTMSLTAEDLAQPGIAQISAYNTATDSVLPNPTWIATGYAVRSVGTEYDAKRRRLYVATPERSEDSRFPSNSVVALDPQTGAIGPSAGQGAVLGPLALAADGSALYVTLNVQGVIRRLDPDTLATVSEFRFRSTPSSGFGYVSVGLSVMPNNPETLAVYYHPDTASSWANLAVFDRGVKRRNELRVADGFDSAMFSPGGKYVFLGSFADFNSPQSVLGYEVDASGVAEQKPLSGPGGGLVTILNGVLYTNRGIMLEAETLEPVGNLGITGALAVDTANRRLLLATPFMLNGLSTSVVYLQAFDLATLQPLGWQRLGSAGDYAMQQSAAVRMYRFGVDGVICQLPGVLTIFRTPLAGPAPATEERAIIHAASMTGGAIAPGALLSIFGTNLGPDSPAAFSLVNGAIPAALANVQVWFDQRPGIPLMVSSGQINVIAPLGLERGKPVRVQTWHFGIPSAKIMLPVATAAPGLFTRDGSGKGFVSVVNQDSSINTASPPGSIVLLYGSGGGAPQGTADGHIAAKAQPLPGAVRVTIGNREATVLYAGVAPGMPFGVFQLNVQVPPGLSPGAAPVTVSIDGQESAKGATLEIR